MITANEAENANVTVDVAIECSGNQWATATAMPLLTPGGTLVVVGSGQGTGLDAATSTELRTGHERLTT
jgi:threonine dehydrogenase-like Zn-dependent dehydrogenase